VALSVARIEVEGPKNVFEVLRSSFDKRRVSISIGDTKISKWAIRGCPGSVLGLTCWNLMFDELLRMLEVQAKDRFIAYASYYIDKRQLPKGDRSWQPDNGKPDYRMV